MTKASGVTSIEKQLLSREFPYFPPFFYNNGLSLRCELSLGTKRSALKRAGEILYLLMPNGPDAMVFRHFITDYSDSGPAGEDEFRGSQCPDTAAQLNAAYLRDEARRLRFLLDNQLKYRHVSVKELPIDADDRYSVRQNRVICWSDGKGFDCEKLIRQCVDDRFNPDIGLVSFENECVMIVYDDRGCDVLFADANKFLALYPKLEPYFLEYDRMLMEERMKRAENSMNA